MSLRCLAAFALWVVALSALAGTPDYDAFSEPDGEIATTRQEIAAWSMLRDPERLEAVYADAVKGMPRAVHVVQQLEATLAASGREAAERSSRPGCLVPGYRELSGTCRPDWSFLDFLSKDRPGGIRLREVIFGAFAARARERGLENQAVLAAVNGLLSLELARGVLLKAETAASVPKVAEVAPAPEVPGPARPGLQSQAARSATSAFGGLSRAAEFGVKPYGELTSALRGTGLQAHHLIEQRFAHLFGGAAPTERLSVAVTRAEHQAFTNAWRQAFPYGAGTQAATREAVMSEAARIYADYPAILRALGL